MGILGDTLAEDFLVEGAPVVEVVEVDRCRADGAVVWKAVGLENGVTCRVRVDVAEDGCVVFVDGGLVELHTGLLADPSFKLGIAWLGLDEGAHRGLVQMESG